MRIVDGIEIPEEFDGIDDDIALETMKEHGLMPDHQEKVEATTQVEPTEEEKADEKTEEKTEEKTSASEEVIAPTGGTAPVKEQETGVEATEVVDDGKTVPYQAMIAERKKRKALQAELDRLKASQGNVAPVQVQQPATQAPLQEEKKEQTTEEQQRLDEYIEKSAIEMFVDKYKREPDDMNRTDIIILGRYAAKVEDGIQKYQEQQQRVASEAQKVNQSYIQFVTEQQNRDEFEEISASFIDEVESLPPDEQEVVKQAFQQCESGKGTPQEILLVKKIWNDVAKKTVQSLVPATKETNTQETTKVVDPPKPSKTDEQKLEQIEKHPKTNLVTGTNISNSANETEMARLLNEMEWEDFEKQYPAYAQKLLEG